MEDSGLLNQLLIENIILWFFNFILLKPHGSYFLHWSKSKQKI